MYSSNNLNSYPNQTFFSTSRPFFFESNPSSKDIETNYCALPSPLLPPPPLSFFQFPFSPFEDNNNNNSHNEIFNHLESPQPQPQQQQHDFLLHQSLPHPEVVMNIDATSAMMNSKIPGKAAATTGQGTAMMEQIPRKRSIKRDRHSKINTARGLRDRRMRLSLEVAKRFFGLQDMLGFDKASKTVEWLLNQAKVEIKQLAREKNQNQNSCSTSVGGAKSASSTSECEGVSSLDEVVVSEINHQELQHNTIGKRRIKVCRRKSAFNPIGREKARERARERTREKMMKTKRLLVADHDESNYWNINPFEKDQQSVNHPSLDLLQPEADQEPKEHSRTVVEEDMAHEDSFLIMNKWSPTAMMFTSLNNSGSILQEAHQFAEFQSLGKHWEAYNNRI